MPQRFRSYIICTTPRSGSTLLCKLLAETRVAGVPDSYVHRPSVERWLQTQGLQRADFATEEAALAAVFASVQRAGTAETGLFGLRLQRGSFDFFQQQAARLYPDAPDDAARVEAAFGPTLYVHLTRTDKLAQAISQVIAEQTGLWHRAADGSELERLSGPKPTTYDAEAIARSLAELTALDGAWKDWFEHHDISPLGVTYEDLAHDPSASLATILQALGRDPALAAGIVPPTARLADATNHAWAARFRAERPDP